MILGPNKRTAGTAFTVKNEKVPTLASAVLQLSICHYLSVMQTVSHNENMQQYKIVSLNSTVCEHMAFAPTNIEMEPVANGQDNG